MIGDSYQNSGVTSPLNGVGGLLNPREREVMRWVLEGLSDRQISIKMGITENTVHYHLKRIYHKLSVHSRAEAVALILGKYFRKE